MKVGKKEDSQAGEHVMSEATEQNQNSNSGLSCNRKEWCGRLSGPSSAAPLSGRWRETGQSGANRRAQKGNAAGQEAEREVNRKRSQGQAKRT
jgi:hypothetical protein